MVYVLLAPGFEESEAVVPTDLLRQAGLETALVSLSGPTVSGSHGITLCADLELSQVDLSNAEMLVLPGGLGGVEALWADDRVSTLSQQSRDSALALLQEAAGKGVWLAALCAAPILLGRWGLLDGRKATSYPTRHSQLGKAEVLPEARAVSDGKFVTGHACGSAFDFGLKLVEVLRGEEAARAVNDVIYYRR